MKRINVQAFAKVNLSIDVKGVLENGYHIVEMVMQQISLHDEVDVSWEPEAGKDLEIRLTTTREDLPCDEGNLAYRAAALMNELYPHEGTITIHIDKRIPVAAGMAGGSSNCAAVIHGLNALWELGLDVAALDQIGARLGSDVPFCIMGQAAASESLRDTFARDRLACHCALATGTGTDLEPLEGLHAYIALSKPDIAVSTAEVYKGMDALTIDRRPDNQALIFALKEHAHKKIYANMVNVLENYTLKVYSTVVYTKDKMQETGLAQHVLMSGSGPTVFAICEDKEHADALRDVMLDINAESFSVRTTE